MRDTILANVGCLAVFQVAGNDARQMVLELGRDRVSEEDIVSLDVHHCYVRATVGVERMPTFSMSVLKPEPGNPAVAARIRADAWAYLRPNDAADAEGRRQVGEYRRLLAERQQDAGTPAPGQNGASAPLAGDGGDGESEEVREYRRLLAAMQDDEGEVEG